MRHSVQRLASNLPEGSGGFERVWTQPSGPTKLNVHVYIAMRTEGSGGFGVLGPYAGGRGRAGLDPGQTLGTLGKPSCARNRCALPPEGWREPSGNPRQPSASGRRDPAPPRPRLPAEPSGMPAVGAGWRLARVRRRVGVARGGREPSTLEGSEGSATLEPVGLGAPLRQPVSGLSPAGAWYRLGGSRWAGCGVAAGPRSRWGRVGAGAGWARSRW